MNYYDNLKIRFSLNNFTTAWQKLEIGIITGCTLSMILFAGAMNLILKSVQHNSRGQTMKSGIVQPPSRAFVDDMTLITKSAIEARWTLEELIEMIDWARMRFKPSKHHDPQERQSRRANEVQNRRRNHSNYHRKANKRAWKVVQSISN